VIGRRDFIATGNRELSPLAQYRTYDAERSMHNTPNTFGIWMIAEVCAWIRDQGGLEAMSERNTRKAALLYDALDASKVWRAHATMGSRSTMNVTWRGDTKEREEELIARAEAQGLSGLRGHRLVGGLRASLYNAFPEDGVRRLVSLMRDVETST
jgi:phosphoserine aminotransferase